MLRYVIVFINMEVREGLPFTILPFSSFSFMLHMFLIDLRLETDICKYFCLTNFYQYETHFTILPFSHIILGEGKEIKFHVYPQIPLLWSNIRLFI